MSASVGATPALRSRNRVTGILIDAPVGAKVLTAVALVAIVAAVVGGVALTRISSLNARLGDMKAHNVDSLRYLDEARTGLEQMFKDAAYYEAKVTATDEALAAVRADDA